MPLSGTKIIISNICSKVILSQHCVALRQKKHTLLRFDFDGYGESDGAQEENTVPKMIQDAKAVWDYAHGPRLPVPSPAGA